MRLLNSKTLKLHEFIGTQVPRYAILSHKWDDGEVSFQDLMNGNTSDKKGYDKIKQCCEVALSDGFKYAWVDTCCIDKTSSSELSEAINSMYRWYKEAAVCYAILSDVSSDEDCHLASSSFKTSRWFTRGWTLQELIAPASLVFYGRDWKEIGTKYSLRGLISEITKIHIGILSGDEKLNTFSIAQKMSWASQRHTTRIEDLAYCLMGIFDVNMPLLYGEGRKSFFRLQEQIIRYSDDQSIFAWTSERNFVQASFLAMSPRGFMKAGDIVQTHNKTATPFSLTNQGLYMQASLCEYQPSREDYTFLPLDLKLLSLDCKRRGDENNLCVVVDKSMGGLERYFRTECSFLPMTWESTLAEPPKSIYMWIDHNTSDSTERLSVSGKCYVDTRGLRENGIRILKIDQLIGQPTGSSMALWICDPNFVGGLQFRNRAGDRFNIILGNRRNNMAMMTAVIHVPKKDSSEGPLLRSCSSYDFFSTPGSDRIRLHDPSKSMWIKVSIRAQHISEDGDENESETGDSENGYKVCIEWDQPGDSRVYESINLKELAISAGILKDQRGFQSLSQAYEGSLIDTD